MATDEAKPKCPCSTTNLLIGLVVVIFLIALFRTMMSSEGAVDPHICLQIPDAPGCSKVLGLSEHLRGFASPAEARAGIAQPYLVKGYENMHGGLNKYLAATHGENMHGGLNKYLAATHGENMHGGLNKYLAATHGENMHSGLKNYLAATH